MKSLATNLTFTEAPRWHDGRLYFSDFYSHRVLAVDESGNLETIAEVANQPSGLGWLPDGRMLIVSMIDRKLLRREQDGTLVVHADLSGIATWHCNDMVVDAAGRAYVGNFGFDLHGGGEPCAADLARVDPDGTVSVAAKDLQFPNGAVITPDGQTLIIGETMARQLTAFDIAPDGTLSNRRVWADIAPHLPDGICLDAEGAVWSADPLGNCVVRVKEGGEVTDTLDTGRGAFACMLG
ncbi:MAG: SMP-30/gluconolactonase/LRE family protein, partial [Pseudomonadales bacterium]|nr:SMP-30/gluconolactonase/LRE family protein [Pseudomonadales bacterium]